MTGARRLQGASGSDFTCGVALGAVLLGVLLLGVLLLGAVLLRAALVGAVLLGTALLGAVLHRLLPLDECYMECLYTLCSQVCCGILRRNQ